LVVLGINIGEDRETVEQFLKNSPMSYPTALAAESGIVSAYQVSGFPTFVMIAPDGKIAAYEVGYGNESELTGMPAKAGLKAPR
jgi:protein-disulfide isomerase-like protein with CxxC motif